MIRVFVDASILLSAAYTSKSASYQIIQCGFDGTIELAISELILEEVRRNLAGNSPASLPAFEAFVASAPWNIIDPDRTLVQTLSKYTPLADAAVVGAALRSRAHWLVSYDAKNLMCDAYVRTRLRVTLLGSSAALRRLRKELAQERLAA